MHGLFIFSYWPNLYGTVLVQHFGGALFCVISISTSRLSFNPEIHGSCSNAKMIIQATLQFNLIWLFSNCIFPEE